MIRYARYISAILVSAVVVAGMCGCAHQAGVGPPPRQELVADDLIGADPPRLAAKQMGQLSGLVREAVRAGRGVRAEEVEALLPAAVREEECQVYLAVRREGRAVAEGAADWERIDRAFAAAATRLVAAARRGGVRGAGVEACGIECEVVGPGERVPLTGLGTTAFERYFEPGVHGLGLVEGERWRQMRPGQVVETGVGGEREPVSAMLGRLLGELKAAGGGGAVPEAYRFRTRHWWLGARVTEPVLLLRGMVPVESAAVNARTLEHVVEQLGRRLVERRRGDGFFEYLYAGERDEVAKGENWVRQAGASWALAEYARASGDEAARRAHEEVIAAWLKMLRATDYNHGSRFVDTGEGTRKLGVSALVLLAMVRGPEAERYASERDALAAGILGLQRPDGALLTAYPPAPGVRSEDYFPGEALLALARVYEVTGEARIAEAFARAHEYYKMYFERGASAAFMPWQVQAHALMYELTGRREYAEFVVRMSDWLAEALVEETETPWPDLIGAISPGGEVRGRVASASYLEGFVAALETARRMGDEQRAREYQRVVRLGARFVLQLVVRPEETLYCPRAERAAWGVRTTVTDLNLRVDNVQHALLALAGVRRVLWEEGTE